VKKHLELIVIFCIPILFHLVMRYIIAYGDLSEIWISNLYNALSIIRRYLVVVYWMFAGAYVHRSSKRYGAKMGYIAYAFIVMLVIASLLHGFGYREFDTILNSYVGGLSYHSTVILVSYDRAFLGSPIIFRLAYFALLILFSIGFITYGILSSVRNKPL
jgi:hypothetical protein